VKLNNNSIKISDFEDNSLLIVDDDDPFRLRLGRKKF
jgi:ActR/RegA family two-component response regulator